MLKLRILLIIISLPVFSASSAQWKKWGVEVLNGSSHFTGNNAFKPAVGWRYSAGLGIVYEEEFSKNFFLGTNFLYELKGGTQLVSIDPIGFPGSGDWVLQDFHFAGISLYMGSGLFNSNWCFIAGPYSSLLLKKYTRYRLYHQSVDNTSSFKRVDIGLNYGVFYQFGRFKKLRAEIGLTHKRGLTNLSKEGQLQIESFMLSVRLKKTSENIK